MGRFNTLLCTYTHAISTNRSCMTDCYYIVADETPLFSGPRPLLLEFHREETMNVTLHFSPNLEWALSNFALFLSLFESTNRSQLRLHEDCLLRFSR